MIRKIVAGSVFMSCAAGFVLLALKMAPGNSAAPAQAVSREVVMDGFHLAYSIEGTGRPCLVINDAPAMRRGLSAELRKHFKFIFMDPRMNVPYDTSFDLSRISLNTLLDDIEKVRIAAGEDKVIVFGHSINGLIAYEYARKYPQHVEGVIMNGTPPFRNSRFSSIYRDYWNTQASAERKAALRASQEKTRDAIAKLSPGENMRQTYIANGAYYWHDPAYNCAWLLEGVRWNKEVWDQLFNVIIEGYDISKKDPIRVPVFVSLGRSDFAVPYRSWDGIDKALTNLQIHLFEKSGHWCFLEEPALFDKTLVEWTQQLAAPASGGTSSSSMKFIGATKCKTCHSVAAIGGTAYKVWERSAHANAYRTLLGEEAKKIAKEKGLKAAPSEAPECLKCHVTGRGESKNVDPAFKKEEGVGCEACHGAASGFLTLHNKKDEASKKKALDAGLLKPAKSEKFCLTCHNPQGPTFKGFKFEEAWKKIEHSKPARK